MQTRRIPNASAARPPPPPGDRLSPCSQYSPICRIWRPVLIKIRRGCHFCFPFVWFFLFLINCLRMWVRRQAGRQASRQSRAAMRRRSCLRKTPAASSCAQLTGPVIYVFWIDSSVARKAWKLYSPPPSRTSPPPQVKSFTRDPSSHCGCWWRLWRDDEKSTSSVFHMD